MSNIPEKIIPVICLGAAIMMIGAAYFLWSTKIEGPLIVDDLNFDFFNIETSERNPFSDDLVKVLIVPGHDNENYGAEFLKYPGAKKGEKGNIKEADLTLKVALSLYEKFSASEQIDEVYLLRDENGYVPEFTNYFNENKSEIEKFRDFYKKFTKNKSDFNNEKYLNEIVQLSASENTSLILHGTNRWANENNIDVILHLHFNDYADRGDYAGKYSGFSIYIPQSGFGNYQYSKDVAEAISKELQKNNDFIPSNLKTEKGTVIEDSDLIAIGSNDSLNSAAVLIEYGYIYEKQFRSDEAETVLENLADKTYNAFLEFLSNSSLATS
jgi:N-acetylmuramoyl-L-alanine amidase